MSSTPKVQVSNKTYDKLKPVVQIWLPAFATLYFTLGAIWGLPHTEEVVGTIAAVTTFLGAVLGISSKNYKEHKDGALVINHDDPMKDNYTLELDVAPEDLAGRNEIKFDVRDESHKNHGL